MSAIDRLIAFGVLAALSPFIASVGRGQVSPMRTADVAITMREYSFDMDSTLASGQHVIAIRNAGHQAHLMLLTRLSPEKSSRDVMSSLEHKRGETPGEVVMASAEVKPGDSTLVTVNLAPGRYSLVCTVRGWWNKPHYKSGMARDIVVQ